MASIDQTEPSTETHFAGVATKNKDTEVSNICSKKYIDQVTSVISQYSKRDDNNISAYISTLNEEKKTINDALESNLNTDIFGNNDKVDSTIVSKLKSDVRTIRNTVSNLIEDDNASHIEEAVETELSTSVARSSRKTNKAKKRYGTSGIRGHLYETKLLSLVFFRASTNMEIDQFCLGTNINDVGALDDLCIRYKKEGKNVMIFLQAKHKSDIDKGSITVQDLWRENSDFYLPKYFRSYLDIRQKIEDKDTSDIMFQTRYEESNCYFVLYTTAKEDLKDKKHIFNKINISTAKVKKQSINKSVQNLLCTSENDHTFQYKYNNDDINLLSETILIEVVKRMGKKLFNIIQEDKENKQNSKRYERLMTDKDIRNFHVVLAQKVINVSRDTTEGHRIGMFRKDFFCNDERLMIILRETLFSEALKKIRLDKETIDTYLHSILLNPSVDTISKLIGSVITFNTNTYRLEITKSEIKEDENFQQTLTILQKIPVKKDDAIKAFELAGSKELNFEFRLPLAFGNCDLKIPQNKISKKIESRAKAFTDLIHKARDKDIVVSKNQGIEDAVGNLLVFDDNTESLKFNMYDDSLGMFAKMLLSKLKGKINNLEQYRFIINVLGFPRVSFEISEYEQSFARDFFEHFWFYTCQAKEDEVENIVKKEMNEYYNAGNKNKSIFRVKAEAIFLKFHDEIQRWWKLEKSEAYYLTNNDVQIFDNILNYFVESPLLSVLNFIYVNKTNNNGITFNNDAIKHLCLDQDVSKATIIVSEVINFSSMKLILQVKNRSNYKFLDLDYLLSLPNNNFDIVINEISDNQEDILIILYENKLNHRDLSPLKRIIQVRDDFHKHTIVIVTETYIATKINKILPKYNFLKIEDERNKFSDLTPTSQKNILATSITFQEQKVTFDTVIDCETADLLIDAKILLKIINKEDIRIGKSLMDSYYEEIEAYYIYRSLTKNKLQCEYVLNPGDNGWTDTFKIKTLKDIEGTTVILGSPGMGKSSLLTHLSIETKKTNPRAWIEKIDLLDHKKEFKKWQQEEITIGEKEAFTFICKNVLRMHIFNENYYDQSQHRIKIDVDYINGTLVLNTSTDSVLAINHKLRFELELFIHSYNKGNVILLFDGFEEIYPEYTQEVIAMIKCIAKGKANQHVWIASLPSNDIIAILEKEFKTTYTLLPLTPSEQDCYYNLFFENNIILNELNDKQLCNIDSLFHYVRRCILDERPNSLFRVHIAAIEYFQSIIPQTPLKSDKAGLRDRWAGLNLNETELSVSLKTEEGVPQDMYKLAEYITRNIKETSDYLKWDVNSFHSSELKKKKKCKLYAYDNV